MSEKEQSESLLEHETIDRGLFRRRSVGSQRPAGSKSSSSTDVTSTLPESKQARHDASASHLKTLSQHEKEKKIESAVSVHTVHSQNTSIKDDGNAIGQPSRRRKVKILDTAAISLSIICLIIGIIVVAPALTISWRMGFKDQIIAVGFLISVMNICAEKIVLSCFVALEARYGKSRLQNFNAILAKKFLSAHIGRV